MTPLALFTIACTLHSPEGLETSPVLYPVDPDFNEEVRFNGAKVTYYEVSGHDDAEVLFALRASPGFVAGGHAAVTHWAVQWERPDGGTCAAADITVEVDLEVLFPRWTPPPGAPVAAVGNWQRYVRALAAHEQGHIDLIRAIAARMPAALAAEGCAQVDVLGREALAVLREANAAYDRDTRSGATQGAILFVPRGAPPRP